MRIMNNMINNGNFTATKSYNVNIVPDKSWMKRSGNEWNDFKHLLKK